MRSVVVGASGTVGQTVVEALSGKHEIVRVGAHSGDFQMDIADPASIKSTLAAIGGFDAMAVAAGGVAFAGFTEMSDEQWQFSLASKLMGQINLVREGLNHISDGGSFTLITGMLSHDPIPWSAAATTVNGAIEALAIGAAVALPRGIRINAVSPGVLEASAEKYADFFPGFPPVSGHRVGQAYRKSIEGAQTGQVYRVE